MGKLIALVRTVLESIKDTKSEKLIGTIRAERNSVKVHDYLYLSCTKCCIKSNEKNK